MPVASPAPRETLNPTEEHPTHDPNAEDSKEATSTTHVPPEPTIDPSGLFSVDTNPTPVEELIRSRPIRAGRNNDRSQKRKLGQTDGVALEEYSSESEHSHKKHRGKDPIQIPEADDSFEKGVEARLKAKQERKAAKSNKKRKRQSDSSNGGSSKGPQNKKPKKGQGKQKGNASAAEPKTKLGLRPGPNKRNSGGEAVNGDSHNQRPSKRRKRSR